MCEPVCERLPYLVFALTLSAALASCSGPPVHTQLSSISPELTNVTRGGDANDIPNVEQRIKTDTAWLPPVERGDTYDGEVADFSFGYNEDLMYMNIQVKNKTDLPMTIDWYDATFSNPENKTSKLFINGVKFRSYKEDYSEKDLVRKIPPGEVSIFTIVPMKNISFESYGKDESPRIERNLGGITYYNMDIYPLQPYEYDKRDMEGYKYNLIIPLKIGENTAKYSFDFKLKYEPKPKN